MRSTGPVVLVSPPAAKPCEPSLGIATLKAYLNAHDVACECIDANAEAFEWLLSQERLDAAVATLEHQPELPKRVAAQIKAWPHMRRKLDRLKKSLRGPDAYKSLNGYRTAVTSINRLIGIAASGHDAHLGSPVTLSLSDYLDARVCDMDSRSIEAATHDPERNLFHDYYRDDLIPRIAAMNPSVVGISLIFRNQLQCGLVLAAMLRKALPGVHVTLGGELISAWAEYLEETALADIADSVIPYEGELPLLALGRGRPLELVPNIMYRDASGVFRRNATQKVATLAEVPAPDYSWAPWHLYMAPERAAPMVTARGCYWNKCTFCPEVINPESKLRLARGDDLVAQMDEVHQRYGVTMFHFIDSAMPARSLRAVADHVIDNDLPYRWYGFSRLEPYLFKPGFAARLYAGGCRMMKLGLETASQRLLDVMDKKQDINDVSRVLKALRDAGILVHAYLMFGTPFEEEADAEATRAFVAEHSDCIQFMNCSLMNLAKGSPMAADPPKHGITEVIPYAIEGHNCDLALYDNFQCEGWGRMGARRYLQKQFLKDPDVRPGHLRTPPHFDANHSPFLHAVMFPQHGASAESEETAA